MRFNIEEKVINILNRQLKILYPQLKRQNRIRIKLRVIHGVSVDRHYDRGLYQYKALFAERVEKWRGSQESERTVYHGTEAMNCRVW